jgi:hypothetical protein
VTKQPEIVPNQFVPGNCILRHGFDYEGEGPDRLVDWRTTVIGGDYDGYEVGGSIQPTSIGNKLPPVVIEEVSFGHVDNGDVFTALRIRVQDAETLEVYAETLSVGGTFSCPT